MIYAYGAIVPSTQQALIKAEPYFKYSYRSGMNLWTVHRRKKDFHYEVLRLYRFDQLRQGFICTEITEAKCLIGYMNKTQGSDILKNYPWIEQYIADHPRKDLTSIREYYNDFEKLTLIDFKEAIRMKDINHLGSS